MPPGVTGYAFLPDWKRGVTGDGASAVALKTEPWPKSCWVGQQHGSLFRRMAFYAYNATREAVQTIGPNDQLRSDGVGAYYAQDQTHEAVQPINGIALGSSAGQADQAVRALIGNRKPVLVAREWAVRVTDISWKAPGHDPELVLLPITDAVLKAAEKAAGGHEVPMVAILTDQLVQSVIAEGAFTGTPYELSQQIAVYAVGDGRAVPRPRLLIIATLRDQDDIQAGSAKLVDTARTLGGVLVYMVALHPKTPPRRLPPIVKAVMLMQPGKSVPMLGAPPPPPTPMIVPHGRSARGGMAGFEQRGMLGGVLSEPWFLGSLAFAAAAGLGYAIKRAIS